MCYNRLVINLLKQSLQGNVAEGELQQAIATLGKAIDSCKVHGENTAELEQLYADLLWLKSEILK